MRMSYIVIQNLKKKLEKLNISTSVGDEGGFAPDLPNNEAAMECILEAISDVGLKAGSDIYLGLDCASSEFYRDGLYHLSSENLQLTSEQLIDKMATWARDYPILSIEDKISPLLGGSQLSPILFILLPVLQSWTIGKIVGSKAPFVILPQ